MRKYLLTENERQIIKKYLDTGLRLEGFQVLLHRCHHMQIIDSDLELIKEFLAKTRARHGD